MSNPANTVDQNLLPVQAYFDLQGNFQTFIGQNKPFYATVSPDQSGLHITNSTIDSTTIGATTPSTGVFTNIFATTGQVTSAPVLNTDIANKAYVDAVAQGLAPKQACKVATTGPITLSGLQTLDTTYTTLAGDRVLVKNQSNSAQNGIYIASSGAWTRSPDMDVWSEVPGAYTVILNGLTQGSTSWVTTAADTGTINVTPMPWVQFSGINNYYAGTGLTLSANTFSITPVGTAGTFGSASSVPVYTTNTLGQITSTTNTPIAIANTQVSGLGTMSTQNANNVAITGGSLTGTTINGSLNTITNIGNSSLTNSSITINGNTVSLGGSTTITAANPYALTIGTGLSGTSYDGSAPVTIANTGVLSLIAGTGISVSGATGNVTVTNSLPMVYPGAGIANSTGTAWGTSYSTTGTGTVVALATAPSLNHPTITDYEAFTPTTDPTWAEGRVFYESSTHTLCYYNDNNQMTVNLAQEQIVRVHNISGADIANGVAVYITGATGGTPTVDLAIANNEAKSYALGVTTTDIPNGNFGYVTVNGLVNGIDTDHFSDGAILYLSDTTPGAFTTTQPSSPSFVTKLGVVVQGNPSTGIVLVNVAYQSIDSTNIIGTVSIAHGGTNGTATPTAGAVAYGTGTAYAFTAAGTSGQVLTSAGSGTPTWSTPTAYATVTDDTTTNATRYPLFANVTTGNLTTEYVASTKYQFNPSTGILTATGFSGSGSGLTSLPAGQLSGTIPSGVLGNSSLYIGTTQVALNAASGSITSLAVNISGSAASASTATTATNATNVAVTDDTTTNSAYYVAFMSASTGNVGVKVSSTKLQYNPSTGALTATGGISGGTF